MQEAENKKNMRNKIENVENNFKLLYPHEFN